EFKLQTENPEVVSLVQLLKRPEIQYPELANVNPDSANVSPAVAEQVTIITKYQGYIDRQEEQIARFQQLEKKRIPPDLDYSTLSGISSEAKEKLAKIRPISVGQASRIAGVSPSDITVLLIHLQARKSTINPNIEIRNPKQKDKHKNLKTETRLLRKNHSQ
ncbi:MAG: hypothetical protein QME64_10265, partial [bacterium]|nr:hypothetical protein [bacterium]